MKPCHTQDTTFIYVQRDHKDRMTEGIKQGPHSAKGITEKSIAAVEEWPYTSATFSH